MNQIHNVGRRGFLKGAFAAGTFVLGMQIIPKPLWANASGNTGVFQPDMFLTIASDGTVTIVASPLRNGLWQPHCASAGGCGRTRRRLGESQD